MINQVTLVGNIGRDPELRYTPNGRAVIDVPVAVTRSWPDGEGGWNEETVWVKVVVWGDYAERVSERAAKGQQVTVTGRIAPPEAWTSADGEPRAQVVVVANKIVFPHRNNNNTGPSEDIGLPFD